MRGCGVCEVPPPGARKPRLTGFRKRRTIADMPPRAKSSLATLTAVERTRIRRNFTMALCNRIRLRLFWIPTTRRVAARAIAPRRPYPLPVDATLIGVYSHPFNSADFLTDLDDVIAMLHAQQRKAAHGKARTA